MSTLEELEKRVTELEEELSYTRLMVATVAVNQKIEKWNYKLNVIKPRLINEKMLWLQINYWNYCPVRYFFNDKYFFKYWWRRMFGEKHEIPLLGVWDKAEDIDFDILPEKFVIKRTLSGGSFEVKLVDKLTDDMEAVRREANRWLLDEDRPKARIIAEQQLEFDGEIIVDYKFHVFNGKVGFIFCGVMNKKGGYRTYSYYNRNWKRYDISFHASETIPKPTKLHEMISLAEKVGAFFPFIRVDLFLPQNENIYIGELTDMPFMGKFYYGLKYDRYFGKMLKLPVKSEIEENIKLHFSLFPELQTNPVFLKVFDGNYFIVQPNDSLNSLPLPPKDFMHPMQIPMKRYLLLDQRIRSLNADTTFGANAIRFLEKLNADLADESTFEKWLKKLKSNKARVSILKSEDMAGRVLVDALNFYSIEIAFSTKWANFKKLSEAEIKKCFDAEVIVCANVHYRQTFELNNPKIINIMDIFKFDI